MRILDTANTTIRTKLRTTAGTATAAKICGSVSEMSRFLYPRDRKGEFEPQLLKKNQTSISQDIYGLAVSDTTVSRITDKILPVAKEWQQRHRDRWAGSGRRLPSHPAWPSQRGSYWRCSSAHSRCRTWRRTFSGGSGW